MIGNEEKLRTVITPYEVVGELPLNSLNFPSEVAKLIK